MIDHDLTRKLGLSPEHASSLVHAPYTFRERLPLSISVLPNNKLDWIAAFYTSRAALTQELPGLQNNLALTGQLWLCWPKQSSGVRTDLNDNSVRAIGLSAGLVDVKVAAIDETWSALKFVYRTSERPVNSGRSKG